MRDAPDWSLLPRETPDGVRRALRRPLTRDVGSRARDIGDIYLDLIEPAAPAPAVARGGWGRATIVVAAVAVAALITGLYLPRRGAPAIEWIGEQLGGSSIAFDPVASPDGGSIAFAAMIDGLTQIAVLQPDTGQWRVLTHSRDQGSAGRPAWSPNGGTIYFERLLDGANGVFAVSPLGTEERLVIDGAATPQPLPDGGLLVSRPDGDHGRRLHRLWPESGRLEPLPAFFLTQYPISPYRVAPDGRAVVFFGLIDAEKPDDQRLYHLDLQSLHSTRLAPSVHHPQSSWYFPIDVTADGQSVVFDMPVGNAHRIVSAPLDGSDRPTTLQTMTAMPLNLDIGPDGSLLVDQAIQPLELLRFSANRLERWVLSNAVSSGTLISLPDGRHLIEHNVNGKRSIMSLTPGRDPVPFAQTSEETKQPGAVLGTSVALRSGGAGRERIVVVNVADGRVTRRLEEFDASGVTAMTASIDERTLYCVIRGSIWSVPIDGSTPTRLRPGDGIAMDPNGRELVVLNRTASGGALTRVSLAGAPDRPIPWTNKEYTLRSGALGGDAVSRDGRIGVRLVPRGSWYWPAGYLDPSTGHVTVIPHGGADMSEPGWDSEGRLVTIANTTLSTIWRFRPVPSSQR